MGLLLLLLLAYNGMPAFAGDAGDLRLNTDVITNNRVQNGGAGEFPIRGRLFSDELNGQAKKIKELQARQTDVAGRLDFKKQAGKKADAQQITAMLFQDYHPQVILSKSSKSGHSHALFFTIGAGAAVAVLTIGILAGRWWARRGRMVQNDRNHAAFT